ncbi:rod shape-determining protein MreC [Acutalibacter muris]|uniref:Cell shape-determining protein MreC n=1 Tax=Acutalibacter muris TaxID=1796620 RepID=A0A1Z2XTG3_9FIRM|nr:rod shape-determining protein MreC [Acutalibacter muris]ANU55018.1 rod shape-determining protein MreC [Hungateiclostridiaceae bacterium KB18]ASB41748.1 rod shape-determining protein MreC [Acutalibacter muris]QQR31015.1 rod shape-determining protein MreC [Acutalibacter muris]
MRDFLKAGSFKVLIITVVVLLGLIIYTASAGGSLIASILGFVSTPMQSVATDLTDGVTEFLDIDGLTKDELKALVAALQEENSQLYDKLIDYTQMEQENERLKVQLHISEQRPENEMRSAAVIGRDPNDPFSGFSIGIGTLSGVSEGDPVITDKGLVGVVTSAYATTSKVECLLSENVNVAAVSIDKRESGLIGCNITMASSGLLRLDYLTGETALTQGDIITTSGEGGVYPADLKIGVVESVEKSETDVSKYAVVRPFEDLASVKEVQVIISFPGQGEDDTVTQPDPGDSEEDAE